VQSLADRMAVIAPYCDEVFVIPDTDPTPHIRRAVPVADIEARRCVYVRGDDMPAFPAREWVESVMPVLLLPRTDSVSSSFIRTLYHRPGGGGCDGGGTSGGLGEGDAAIAFAELDYEGKPVLPATGT
jgi:hypothetical protein